MLVSTITGTEPMLRLLREMHDSSGLVICEMSCDDSCRGPQMLVAALCQDAQIAASAICEMHVMAVAGLSS